MTPENSIGDLLRQLRNDTTQLIRDEVALAKTEAQEIGARAARNTAYMAAGALIAMSGVIVLLMGLAHWLSLLLITRGVDVPAAYLGGFLLVALIVCTIGAILVMKARHAFSESSLTPTRTARSLREDKQWAKEKIS
jgi:uncharacterized membrane protein